MSSVPHLLLLGGTGEARLLVEELRSAFPGWRITTSLAGRVSSPKEVPGEVRVGGFGGPEGLASWLHEHQVTAVIDATHPFAERITSNAAEAVLDPRLGRVVPLLRLQRPAWEPGPGDNWHVADTVAEAAVVADQLGDRLLVTTGRQEASAFAGVAAWCLLRSVEAPDEPLPARHEVLLERGPFTLDSERKLMEQHGIDVLVTKNSGGKATAAKLQAARELRVAVVMVRRPDVPESVDVAESIPEALLWLASVSADVAAEQGRRERPDASEDSRAGSAPCAPGEEESKGHARAALTSLGWPITGPVDLLTTALDEGEPVDVDNPTNWPLPHLGDSLSAEHSQVTARLIVTDMDPAMAAQFSTGAPLVVLSPPSLVVGLDCDPGVAAVDAAEHVRLLFADNLLATQSLVTVVALDGSDAAARLDVVAEALDTEYRVVTGEVPAGTAAENGGSAAEAAVTAAGAQVVVPTRTAEHEGGATRVAVGRLAPAP